MIVTFTMNPAIDRTLLIPDFQPGRINHVVDTISDAGGNGVNARTHDGEVQRFSLFFRQRYGIRERFLRRGRRV